MAIRILLVYGSTELPSSTHNSTVPSRCLRIRASVQASTGAGAEPVRLRASVPSDQAYSSSCLRLWSLALLADRHRPQLCRPRSSCSQVRYPRSVSAPHCAVQLVTTATSHAHATGSSPVLDHHRERGSAEHGTRASFDAVQAAAHSNHEPSPPTLGRRRRHRAAGSHRPI